MKSQHRKALVESLNMRQKHLSIQVRDIDLSSTYLLNIRGASENDFIIGDTISFRTRLYPISEPSNPYEFNYKRWLRIQGITHQAYCDRDDIILSKCEAYNVFAISMLCNRYLKASIKKYLPSQEYTALLHAIVLGDKSGMSASQKSIFESTGTMHIMAVSGLHVGLVAGIILLLLPVTTSRRSIWLRTGIYILSIWSFVLITGAKSSAVRAAIMFSLFFSAQLFNRSSHAINALIFAAFIMIVFDPFVVLDIGFQFSLMAVLSILVFFPLIQPLLKPEGFLLNMIWDLMAVSLSVQVLLAPVSIFYFHEFPSCFLLSNLIAIPMAACIMILSALLMISSIIMPQFALAIGHVLHGTTALGYSLLEMTQVLNFINLVHLWPGVAEIAIYYFIIFFTTIGILAQSSFHYRIGMSFIFILGLSIGIKNLSIRNSAEIIAYGPPFSETVDIRIGRQITSWNKFDKQRAPAFRSKYGGQWRLSANPHSNQLISWDNESAILCSGSKITPISQDIAYLILNRNIKTDSLMDLLCSIEPREVISTYKMSLAERNKVKEMSETLGFCWHHTQDQGARRIRISNTAEL